MLVQLPCYAYSIKASVGIECHRNVVYEPCWFNRAAPHVAGAA